MLRSLCKPSLGIDQRGITTLARAQVLHIVRHLAIQPSRAISAGQADAAAKTQVQHARARAQCRVFRPPVAIIQHRLASVHVGEPARKPSCNSCNPRKFIKKSVPLNFTSVANETQHDFSLFGICEIQDSMITHPNAKIHPGSSIFCNRAEKDFAPEPGSLWPLLFGFDQGALSAPCEHSRAISICQLTA